MLLNQVWDGNREKRAHTNPNNGLSVYVSILDVTQAQIDEIRLRPEKEMLNDLKRRYAAGDDLQSLDAQGAAPVGPLRLVQFCVAYH